MMKKTKGIIGMLLVCATVLAACSGGASSTAPASSTAAPSASASAAPADDGKVYEMKISHLTTEIDPLHKGYLFFNDLLTEKTNGRIKITIYPNKQLANSDREQAEMVQNNLAQLGTTPSFTLAALNEDLNEFFIYDYPYLMPDTKTLYGFADGEIGQGMLKELEEKTGIHAYPGFPLGWVKVSCNANPITAPSDIKGLKIRTTSSDMYIELMKSFGANPTIVNYGELFTALQQKTVDGMMTTTSLYVSDRFYEVQKYMGCINPFTIFHIPMVSHDFYYSLPEDLRKTFDECMYEYIDYMRELEDSYELESVKILKEKGMQVTEYTEDQMKAFRELGLKVSDENADVVGAEFLAKVKASLS